MTLGRPPLFLVRIRLTMIHARIEDRKLDDFIRAKLLMLPTSKLPIMGFSFRQLPLFENDLQLVAWDGFC